MSIPRVMVIGTGANSIGQAVEQLLDAEGKYEMIVPGEMERKINVRVESDINTVIAERRPTHVVYAAGINRLAHNHELNVDVDARDIFDVNVFGFMRLIAALERTGPRPVSVVAISSDAATRPMRTSMAYCASKAALNMAVKCAAREGAPWLRVNAVSPGMTGSTGMSEYIDATVPELRGWSPEKAREYESSQIPMRRRATKYEVAHLVISTLFGPAYQTGSIIEINGGR